MEYKLTSVKILKDLYRQFKLHALNDEFTLQKLVNRSMDLYILDDEFKSQIIEKKRIKIILKKISKESKKKKIDPKITNTIWKSMIRAFINYEFKNFKKK